jgi:type I restriction enzyme S subunit
VIFLTKWEETTFSDAIEINPKRELKKGIECKFVSMDNLQEHNKTIHNFDVRKFSGGSKFMNKDTLMARITPCLENGKTAFVNILDEGEVAGGSTEFNVLSAREGKTIPEFVYYLSITPEIRGAVIKSMTGTSGRQRVDSGVF